MNKIKKWVLKLPGRKVMQKKEPFDKKEYDKKFLKEHYKWINLPFNIDKPEEMELYDFIKSRPEKQVPFIKQLIREAMDKEK